MFIIFREYLFKIEGFTTEMESEIQQFIMGSTDVITLSTQIEGMLIERFKFTQYQISSFHYYFQISLVDGIKKVFDVKDGDIQTKITSEAPVAPPATIDVPNEFTQVERLIIYYYFEFQFQMITQQEYYQRITRLEYTFESVKALLSRSATQIESIEWQFKTTIMHQLEINLIKIQGFR